MIYLLIVSLIWAFSFGLIKTNLSNIDANFVSFSRMLISFIVFIPFLKIKHIEKSILLKLFFTGMVQFGLMYISYIYSFQFLEAYEVALFTIFTPLYVSIINGIITKRFNKVYILSSLLAFAGAGIIKYSAFLGPDIFTGFMLVQISNISFAFGQIFYRKTLQRRNEIKDKDIFAVLYAGGVFITLTASLFTADFTKIEINTVQFLTLIYLGAAASGLCFFLWNYGARRTNAGALAVFNNLKIPLAILVSLIFFGEKTEILKLILGGAVITAALYINEKLHARAAS